MTHTELKEKVASYRLLDDLLARLNLMVKGGVAAVTIRKAFKEGPKTALLRLILDQAEIVVNEHEESIKELLQTNSPA